jgi:hypothetical protein
LRAHAPTSRHAEILFDLLVDLLGDQAVVTTANDGTLLKLFRRDAVDSSLIVPWPVAQLSVRGRIGWVSPTFDTETGEIVPERERPAGKTYRLRGLASGQIELYDGNAKVGVFYGDDGAVREASIDDLTPSRLAEIPVAIASMRAQPVELIASCVEVGIALRPHRRQRRSDRDAEYRQHPRELAPLLPERQMDRAVEAPAAIESDPRIAARTGDQLINQLLDGTQGPRSEAGDMGEFLRERSGAPVPRLPVALERRCDVARRRDPLYQGHVGDQQFTELSALEHGDPLPSPTLHG